MRFGEGFRFQVRENLGQGAYDVLGARLKHNGELEVIASLTCFTLPHGSAVPGPFLQLNVGEAQGLLDELWRAGLRPTDQRDHGTTGHVKALEHHAEVMEAIATGLLRRDGVEL